VCATPSLRPQGSLRASAALRFSLGLRPSLDPGSGRGGRAGRETTQWRRFRQSAYSNYGDSDGPVGAAVGLGFQLTAVEAFRLGAPKTVRVSGRLLMLGVARTGAVLCRGFCEHYRTRSGPVHATTASSHILRLEGAWVREVVLGVG